MVLVLLQVLLSNLLVWFEKGLAVVVDFEVIDLGGLFVQIVHNNQLVDNLDSNERAWRELDMFLVLVDFARLQFKNIDSS